MKIRILQDFKFAFDGCRVVSFAAGDVLIVEDAECIDVATSEGWAEIVVDNDEQEEKPTQPEVTLEAPKAITSQVANKARNVASQNK